MRCYFSLRVLSYWDRDKIVRGFLPYKRLYFFSKWLFGITFCMEVDDKADSMDCSNFIICCLSQKFMMTSSNGNIFRVTGPLCGEFTGPGEFPTQRPATRSFDVFFDLRPNKRLSKQPWGWWFETPSLSLWRQCNVAHLPLDLMAAILQTIY